MTMLKLILEMAVYMLIGMAVVKDEFGWTLLDHPLSLLLLAVVWPGIAAASILSSPTFWKAALIGFLALGLVWG